jgi:hypothetical protein
VVIKKGFDLMRQKWRQDAKKMCFLHLKQMDACMDGWEDEEFNMRIQLKGIGGY